MTNEIILAGITFEELKESFRIIIKNELSLIIFNLPSVEPSPELITRKQTAQILGISLPTLNDWTKTGIVPAQRIGTRIRYNRAQVYSALKDIETLKYKRA